MTRLGAAAGAVTTVVWIGQMVAVLASPMPLLVISGLVALIWLPVAILLLMPVWSSCPRRNARAAAMIDRVAAAIGRSRCRPSEHLSATQPPGPPG